MWVNIQTTALHFLNRRQYVNGDMVKERTFLRRSNASGARAWGVLSGWMTGYEATYAWTINQTRSEAKVSQNRRTSSHEYEGANLSAMFEEVENR